MEMQIIYQDSHIIAINKPPNCMVHRTVLIPKNEVVAVEALSQQLGQKVQAIHRLDRPTTGVLLFGLTKNATQEMTALFRERKIEKEYRAVVKGHPENVFVVDRDLKPSKNKAAQSAVTHFKKLAQFHLTSHEAILPNHEEYALLSAQPITGRRHQIRKHLQMAKHPILVDKRYGNKRINRFFRMHFHYHDLLLHAYSLRFIHPFTGKKIALKADLPAKFQEVLQQLTAGNLPYTHQ